MTRPPAKVYVGSKNSPIRAYYWLNIEAISQHVLGEFEAIAQRTEELRIGIAQGDWPDWWIRQLRETLQAVDRDLKQHRRLRDEFVARFLELRAEARRVMGRRRS